MLSNIPNPQKSLPLYSMGRGSCQMLTVKLFQGFFNIFSLKYYSFFTLTESFAVKFFLNTRERRENQQNFNSNKNIEVL